MKLYGFMRIYDAKKGQVSPLIALFDRLIRSTDFLTILLWSPGLMYNLGVEFSSNRLFVFSVPVFVFLRTVISAITLTIGVF